MKKRFTFIVLALVLSAVSGRGGNFVVTNAPYSWDNGTYVETGTYNGKAAYLLANTNWYIAWSGTLWQLGSGCCGGHITGVDCDNSSTSATCPVSGWSCAGMVVAPETDNLNYSTYTLRESVNNDGSLPAAVTIALKALTVGQAFTDTNGDDYAVNKIVFGNLPAGLTPHAILTDTFITLTFTGAAIHNNHADDAYITLQFTDAAFVNGPASGVTDSKDSVQVLFRQQFTVASTEGDFTTVAGAIAGADAYDIISISGETFTEAGIEVDKALIFKGQGADKTIVQASASYNTATDRVFDITTARDTVSFYDMTIRYGKVSEDIGDATGGGIQSMGTPVSQETPVKIYSCAITDNIVVSTSGFFAYGGGICCIGMLNIYSSLISGNTAQSATGTAAGGGIYNWGFTLVNSTVTGNTATGGGSQYGGGIYADINSPIFVSMANTINSTIVGNTAEFGAGIYAVEGPSVGLTNAIVYGNITGNDVVYSNGGPLNVSNCILGAASTAAINGTDYNVSTADPLLSPLADNGGPTKTMAINAGSFAIDEGATGDSIPTTDQRGYSKNGVRDIGAFEYGGIATGIQPVSAVKKIHVYPNPASDFINVERVISVNAVYTITDLLGQTEQTGILTAKNTVINIRMLSSGVYILKAGAEQFKLLKE